MSPGGAREPDKVMHTIGEVACACKCACACMHSDLCVPHPRTQACACACMCTCTCICVCTCVCVCVSMCVLLEQIWRDREFLICQLHFFDPSLPTSQPCTGDAKHPSVFRDKPLLARNQCSVFPLCSPDQGPPSRGCLLLTRLISLFRVWAC